MQLLAVSAVAHAQAPLRKIGELELSVLGLSAAPSPLNATVPKNTASGIRVVVTAGVPFGTPGATNNMRIALIGPEGGSA